MMNRFAAIFIAGLVAMTAGAPAIAEELFLRVIAPHDEPDGYCLDIAGHRDNVQPQRPLQVHTCKYGIWNLDGIFETTALADGALRMPHFDLCVEAAEASVGADLMLASCDAAGLQDWRQLESGEIVLASQADLCVTIRDAPGQSAGPVYIRNTVSLDLCTTEGADRQRWTFKAPTQP